MRKFKVLELFKGNFQAGYTPGEHLVLDEILLEFYGRCGIKQFIPSKRPKYGIKLFLVNDPRNMYLLNLMVYEGKEGHHDAPKDENFGAYIIFFIKK